MDLKEVCLRTGLKANAIQYYVNNGALSFNSIDQTDFTEEMVQEIQDISDLSRARFTIEDIIHMKKYPWMIPNQIRKWMSNAKSNTSMEELINVFNTINVSSIESIYQLAQLLHDKAIKLPLPSSFNNSINLNFGKLDGVTNDDKMKALEEFSKNQERLYSRGHVFVNIIVLLYSISTILYVFTSIINGSFNIITLGLRIAMAIALYKGVAWVRYLYVIIGFLGLFLYINFLIVVLTDFAELNQYFSNMQVVLFIVISIILDSTFIFISSLLLLFHKGVKEYLYSQRNG